MGYSRAGFDEIVGVDINPQPHYPFEFVQADAMTYPLDGFDLIHASPPCHDHSNVTREADGSGWMLQATIERLLESGTPWVCENVVGPEVHMSGWFFVLCGSMFGMKVKRHRRFGSSMLVLPPACRHKEQGRPYTITGNGDNNPDRKHSLKPPSSEFWRYLDMPWLEGKPHYGVTQAIPPAYTQFIGEQFLANRPNALSSVTPL